ncbi:metallophosphoesterase [Bacteroidota bacterium]
MKINKINSEPISEIPYYSLSTGRKVERCLLHVFEAEATGLPDEIDTLICTSDLQGTLSRNSTKLKDLLGIYVAKELASFFDTTNYSAKSKTGVLLAGDFFCQPDLAGRGGYGFVDEVWYAFSSKFRWVAGVAGNHDNFRQSFYSNPKPNIFYLNNNFQDVDNIKIGGLSGIIGDSKKRPNRYSEEDYIMQLRNLTNNSLDILILHQHLDMIDFNKVVISQRYETSPKLIIHGHKPTTQNFYELPNGTQIVNVHEKVMIIKKAKDLICINI